MTFACPTCEAEVETAAHYCSACGASLMAPGLAKAEAEPEAPKGGWLSRVFRLSKSSRPGSRFSWSFDVEVTTSSGPPSPDSP